MEYATCHLYFLRIHTRLKARVYTENKSDTWHIPWCPTRKHCITSIHYSHFQSKLCFQYKRDRGKEDERVIKTRWTKFNESELSKKVLLQIKSCCLHKRIAKKRILPVWDIRVIDSASEKRKRTFRQLKLKKQTLLESSWQLNLNWIPLVNTKVCGIFQVIRNSKA